MWKFISKSCLICVQHEGGQRVKKKNERGKNMTPGTLLQEPMKKLLF
jgi:hypothetical protein